MTAAADSRPGLLIVDHGTRNPAGDRRLAEFAARVGGQRDHWLVRHAHMELTSPTFLEGIGDLVSLGATEILIHLHFLGDGFHTRESIPNLVAEARATHPDIPIHTTAPLGDDPRLAEIVTDRMDAHEKGAQA